MGRNPKKLLFDLPWWENPVVNGDEGLEKPSSQPRTGKRNLLGLEGKEV